MLGVLSHELIHVVLPVEAGHGKLFREAAIKLGLEGQMRHARRVSYCVIGWRNWQTRSVPCPMPRSTSNAARDNRGPADRPEKQGTRLLKAVCAAEGCDYNVRLVATHARLGPPGCPLHGAMTVEWPDGEGRSRPGGNRHQRAFKRSPYPLPPLPLTACLARERDALLGHVVGQHFVHSLLHGFLVPALAALRISTSLKVNTSRGSNHPAICNCPSRRPPMCCAPDMLHAP